MDPEAPILIVRNGDILVTQDEDIEDGMILDILVN
jgi:hypothetical protein